VRQKSKGPLIGDTTGDIKQDLSQGQLAGIGAVAMAWNSVESFVDEMLRVSLGMQVGIGEKVLARINAFDAKIGLIKSAATTRLGLSKEECEDLLKSLDAAPASAKDLKEYRDAVIHCQLIDVRNAQGLLIKRDAQYDVLLSQEVLDGLYNRLISVRDELRTVCLIFLTLDEALKTDAQADLQTSRNSHRHSSLAQRRIRWLAAPSIKSAADHTTGVIASRTGFRARAMLQANHRCIGTRWQRCGARANAALKIRKSRRSQASAASIAVKIPNSASRSLIAIAKVRAARASLSRAQAAA